jgi:hypothetical protein
MTSDLIVERLRAANPAPAAVVYDDDLFARITATPVDPRLAGPARTVRRRPRRVRMGPRRLALVAAAVLLVAAGGAIGAIRLGLISASPKTLFEANPAAQFPGAPRQQVIPQSVRRATTFTVPGVGRFEWWIGLSRKGWLCEAIRQPDGTWADIAGDKYQLSGPVPGCGRFPWHDARGFSYWPTSIQSPSGQTWHIAYGYVPTIGNPVKVRDRISGATAPIGDGRYFAIVMPTCKGKCHITNTTPPHLSGRLLPGYQLQTLDRSGRALVTDHFDPGK